MEDVGSVSDTSWPASQLSNDQWVRSAEHFQAISALVASMIEIKSSLSKKKHNIEMILGLVLTTYVYIHIK